MRFRKTCAGLGAVKVTMPLENAQIALRMFFISVSSALIPEGISTETTGRVPLMRSQALV